MNNIYITTDDSGTPLEWPLSFKNITEQFKSVSFPKNFNGSDELNIHILEYGIIPEFNIITQHAQEVLPPVYDDVSGKYKIEYVIADNSPELVVKEIENFAKQHVIAVQKYMDDFALTRNYDDIKSAVTYMGCGVAKFEQEATYCSQMRAQIWESLYSYMADVELGNMEMETDSDAVIALLPVLEWPEPAP